MEAGREESLGNGAVWLGWVLRLQWLAWVQAAVLSCPSFACSSWMRSCLASYSYRSTSVRPTKVSRSRASTCLSISARSSTRICSRSSTGTPVDEAAGSFHTQGSLQRLIVCHDRAVTFDRVHTVFPEHLLLRKLTSLDWPTPTICRCQRRRFGDILGLSSNCRITP